MVWYIALGVAFATIALAELADKTQLVTIGQACRYPYPPVLAGAALALVVVTAVGVVIGTFLNWLLPVHLLNLVAGLLFLFFGALMLVSWLRDRRRNEEVECEVGEEPGCEQGPLHFVLRLGAVSWA